MRIRLSQLRQIIKEEVSRALAEEQLPYAPDEEDDDEEYEGPGPDDSFEVERGFGRNDPYGPPKGPRSGGKY